ncbi:unnamed protein product [Caenorhabditis auriculariae]|uniref:RNA-directed DNA polymerase n=1 Tax=Caenorhabditis auriculariae TaxID=2777116 RepID=A0A8S1GNS5_9PELO|nr:unnamed protein product [Caenorhabditis auriculariae]
MNTTSYFRSVRRLAIKLMFKYKRQTSTQRSYQEVRDRFSHLDPEAGKTFPKWINRYGEVITVEGKSLDETTQVRLLLNKLPDEIYEQFAAKICPKNPSTESYADVVATLSDYFDVKRSLLSWRFACTQISRLDEIQRLTRPGLDAAGDTQIRAHFIKFMERRVEKQTTHHHHGPLRRMAEDSTTEKLKSKNLDRREFSKGNPMNRMTCWNCGRDGHSSPVCRNPKSTCDKCHRKGHLAKFCKSTRVTNPRKTTTSKPNTWTRCKAVTVANAESPQVQAVRRFIDVEVDGVQIPFQMDTGSDLTLVGTPEWERLGKPPLENVPFRVKNASGSDMDIKGRFKCNFQLKDSHASGYAYDNANPVFKQKRPVPYGSLAAVEGELNRLQQLGVIEPVTHSQWAAPVVCIKKASGKIRVCSDFSTGLNSALEDEEYPLPTSEEIFANLNGGSVFTQIDLSDAYLQVELDPESQPYAATLRNQDGSGDFPEKSWTKMITGLNGVAVYLDDIIVVGRSQAEHRENVRKVFARIREYGFHLKLDKCAFEQSEIKYLGFILNASGRRPDPEKVKVIHNMTPPRDQKVLRSFLGMISYYGQFIPNIKALRGPLDRLLVQDEDWRWTRVEERCFQKLKDVLSSDLNLVHFHPKHQIVLAADASEYGIGTVISHIMPDGTEKAYCTCSKKFHKFIYGRRFTLRTDHKPLLSIFGNKNGIPVHSQNRLVRWAIILLGYNFHIEYVNTDKFGQADALSRMIQHQEALQQDDVVIAKVEVEVQEVLRSSIRRLPLTNAGVQTATRQDKDLQHLMKTPRFPRRNGSHEAIGPIRCFFWPGIDADCENFVRNCKACSLHSKSPRKVPLQPWPAPERVWQRIHIDFAGPDQGQWYLVVVDAKSKYPEVKIVHSISAANTVKVLKEIFARNGYPETIVSDNGTQFTSQQFADMCQNGHIQHIRTAPYCPQSNGQAERFVDTLKRALKKLQKGEEKISENILNQFLMIYRRTPLTVLQGKSAAQIHLGRQLRTELDALKPRDSVNPLPLTIHQQNMKDCQLKLKQQQKSNLCTDNVWSTTAVPSRSCSYNRRSIDEPNQQSSPAASPNDYGRTNAVSQRAASTAKIYTTAKSCFSLRSFTVTQVFAHLPALI